MILDYDAIVAHQAAQGIISPEVAAEQDVPEPTKPRARLRRKPVPDLLTIVALGGH